IFAALSETTAEVVIEAMQAAKAAGAVVSFDLNYREKLWSISGGAAGDAPEFLAVIEVKGHHGAGGFSGLHGFDDDLGGGFREGGEDAAGVEPADAAGKDFGPIEIAGLEPGGGFIRAIVEDHGSTHAVAAIAIDGCHV